MTITIDDDLMAELGLLIAARGDQNRSEAIRDLARVGLHQAAADLVPERTTAAPLSREGKVDPTPPCKAAAEPFQSCSVRPEHDLAATTSGCGGDGPAWPGRIAADAAAPA